MAEQIKRLVVRTASSNEKTYFGRQAWALDALIVAGDKGCTPIDNPGPRWSDYVMKLRRSGLMVETIGERHGGAYAGNHARYVLRSEVEVLGRERAA